MQFFSTNDTLFQALKKGEIDYARKLSPEQFKQLQGDPAIKTVNGKSNGWTELGFNTYGTGTGKTIKGGGPSTKALQDPAFRDALGYAIDKQKLVDNVIGGLGTIGIDPDPAGHEGRQAGIDWHADPTTPRTFDIELAKQKLDAAGYVARRVRQAARQGRQADQPQAGPARLRPELRQGRPVHQGLVRPARDQGHPEDLRERRARRRHAPARGRRRRATRPTTTCSSGPGRGARIRTTRSSVFICDAIGGSSDSLWCNPDYDKLYEQQLLAKTPEERKAIVDQMQQMWYDAAPYHILYYDDNLHAYRTDKFAGWQNQPAERDAALRLRHPRLHPADRRQRGAQPDPPPSGAAAPSSAPSAGGTPAPSAAGSGVRHVERRHCRSSPIAHRHRRGRRRRWLPRDAAQQPKAGRRRRRMTGRGPTLDRSR